MDHKWTIILTNFHYVIKGCHQGVMSSRGHVIKGSDPLMTSQKKDDGGPEVAIT